MLLGNWVCTFLRLQCIAHQAEFVPFVCIDILVLTDVTGLSVLLNLDATLLIIC